MLRLKNFVNYPKYSLMAWLAALNGLATEDQMGKWVHTS